MHRVLYNETKGNEKTQQNQKEPIDFNNSFYVLFHNRSRSRKNKLKMQFIKCRVEFEKSYMGQTKNTIDTKNGQHRAM